MVGHINDREMKNEFVFKFHMMLIINTDDTKNSEKRLFS